MTAIHLTTEQIQDILSNIRLKHESYLVPIYVSIENIRNNLAESLKQIKLIPNQFETFKKIIVQQFYKSLVAPGEAVGINAAQNISEPTTQGTLNTFHNTGISAKNVTLGFQRATELYNATDVDKQSTPTCCIYFSDPSMKLTDLHIYTDPLVEITLEGLVTSATNYSYDEYIQLPREKRWWVDIYTSLYNKNHIEFDKCSFICRFQLSIEKMHEVNLKIQTIKQTIESKFDVQIIYSPLAIGIIDIIFFDVDSSCFNILVTKLLEIHIQGVPGITKLYPRKIIENNIDRWVVDTDGTNLLKLLSSDGIDQTKTVSNSCWEVYNTLGIEACRLFLQKEFNIVISSSGSYINPRHVELLVDKMTNTGTIKAIARYGIETDQYPPITRATFEETMKHLVNSAIGSEIDELTGISSSVVVGKKIKAGTGFVQLNSRVVKIT